MSLGRFSVKNVLPSCPLPSPRDWCIDLLPNTTLPKSRMKLLSKPETQAMEDYIKETLAEDFIWPSNSPVASRFFFVKKKDDRLRPCIDYRGLNSITIKHSYPLPGTALEAQVFNKVDLRKAYNLVCMQEDEWKTEFITHKATMNTWSYPMDLLICWPSSRNT